MDSVHTQILDFTRVFISHILYHLGEELWFCFKYISVVLIIFTWKTLIFTILIPCPQRLDPLDS